MILLVYIFLSLSFHKTDKFSSSVSKYLVINGSCVMMICKTIMIILLEIYCIIDILNFCIFGFLITSLICSYAFFKERKYQNYKNNPIIVAKFVLNIIYCWGCILLFFGNIIKKKSFKGLIVIFIISSLLFIVVIFVVKINNFKHSIIDTTKDIELYNNIRSFINATELKNKDRKSMMNLISYSYNKSFLSHIKTIKNVENLEKVIEHIKDLMNNNSDMDFILYQHIDELYKQSLNIFKASPILLVNYAVFQMEKLHKYQKSYKTLLKATEIHNLSFSEEFFIYRIKRNLEERGIEMGIEQTHISFAYQTKEILTLIKKIATFYSQFWTLLLNKNESIDINHLKNLGIKINDMKTTIKEKYQNLVSNGLNTKKLTTLYANFVKEILNDPKDNQNIKINDLDNDEKFKESFFNINYLISKSDYQFILINGYGDSFGIIKKISLEICHLLGYSDMDLIGKNMNIILPDSIRKKHENMLRTKIKNLTSHNYSVNNLKELFVLFRNSAKFLVPAYVDIGIIFDENNNSMIFLKLSTKPNRNTEKLRNECFVLLNDRLFIQNFTPNCLNLLGLESHYLNTNLDITQFILDFNDEVLNKLSNQSEEKNPLNDIFINKFLDKSDTTIKWKNNKKFECSLERLNILDEKIGFFLKLDNIDSNYESSNFKNFDKISRKNRSKKSICHVLQNNSDSFCIENDYIPSHDEEINFDIEGKTFFFKNKNDSKDEGYLTIQKFFEKKYNDDINLDKEFIEEEDSNISSSYESKEEEENEEEEEEQNIVPVSNVNKDKLDSTKSIFKQDKVDYLNYYKINSKIKFSMYDYNTHSFIEIKSYHFESQVEKIMNEEKNQTKRISIKKEINNNNPINKYNLGMNNKNKKKLLNTQNYSENNVVKKLISPHFINKSIIILSFVYFLSLLILLFAPYLVCKQILKSIKRIYHLSYFVHIQCSITEDVILICYYIIEYILVKNPKYEIKHINNRTEYSEFISNQILTLYNKSEERLTYFIYNKPIISSEAEKIIENYYFTLNFFYYEENYALKAEESDLLMNPSLQIYFFCAFSFIHSTKTEQHFMNSKSQFITSNFQRIADGMAVLNQYYLDEITSIIKKKKVYLWVIFIIYFISEIGVSYICVLGKIKSIREKEKYLNIFYKIDIEIIRMMNFKCLKYSKIQIDKNNLTQKQDYLHNTSEDDEDESLITNKENEFLNQNFDEKKRKVVKIKKENIFKNKVFKREFTITSFFHTILTIIILILIIYVSKSYIKFFNSALINVLLLAQERYFLKSINYMRNEIKNSGYYLNRKKIENDLEVTVTYIKENFFQTREHQIYIYNNISKNGLPGNATSILSNINVELCSFFNKIHSLTNLTCDSIGNNIVNYGLMNFYAYYLKEILAIAFDYYDILNTAIQNNFIYYDFGFGTAFYYDSIPENINKELYLKLNPFDLFNDIRFRDLNLIVVDVLIPFYQTQINILFKNFQNFYNNTYNITTIVCFGMILFVILSYIFEILPMIIRENKDINKTRIILSVIPQNVIYEIIKNQNLKENNESIQN